MYILINASGTQVIGKIITKVVSHPTDLKIERKEGSYLRRRVGFQFATLKFIF